MYFYWIFLLFVLVYVNNIILYVEDVEEVILDLIDELEDYYLKEDYDLNVVLILCLLLVVN